MAAPKRRPRSRDAVGLALAIVALLGGAIAAAVVRPGGGGDAKARAVPGPASTTTSAPGPSPPSASAGPLLTPSASGPGQLVPGNADLFTPPANWVWVPDASAGTGPVDVNKAAALDGVSALSAVGLRELGFVRGVTRQWQDNGVILVDLVYTFTTAQGASEYSATTAGSRAQDPSFSAADPGPGAPPGAVSFTTSAGGSLSRVLIVTSGVHAVVIGLVQPRTPPDAHTLADLASEQVAFSAAH